MWIKKGEKIKSRLNGQLYLVKEIGPRAVILESENGFKQSWTNIEILKYFFDKIEDANPLHNPVCKVDDMK